MVSPAYGRLLATPHDRLLTAFQLAALRTSDILIGPLGSVSLADPAELQAWIAEHLAGYVGRTFVAGTLDRRLILIERHDGYWAAADLSGHAHRTRAWPYWITSCLRIHDVDSWLSLAKLDQELVYRLTRPRLLLVALYHPEHFPLPRFPLGISDVARAARATFLGQVSLIDMQLGATLDDIVAAVINQQPDILGISATFGQHDLMVHLLNAIVKMQKPPLVVAGGSLTARNERLLLECYPDLLIARGAGEPTIQDVLAYWHGDLAREQIRGLGYAKVALEGGVGSQFRSTPRSVNRLQTDIFPELDLLDATLRHKGVAQLESSRGCTNFCSFCPRSHKGQWWGAVPTALPWILTEIDRIFCRHPNISRTIYLVDEEFIGRDADAVSRALAVANALHQSRFRWETSCRIDQVARLDCHRDWHLQRATMWRTLLARGLRRCLFGVESGVDSILERFNKETTADQNVLAIRTLSALGIPTRFTYITFDHLMTEDELRRTHAFQGRTDLLLKHVPELSLEELVDGVRDPDFVANYATGQPFYTAISYMLVSMECLIGAPYTRKVQNAGLAGPPRPSMGRHDAVFADWRIGRCSEWAQLWVDRNFALDYMLKSLEKILEGEAWSTIRRTRSVIKKAAYTVLGHMLGTVSAFSLRVTQPYALDACLQKMIDIEFAKLRNRMTSVVPLVQLTLPNEEFNLLRHEFNRWLATGEWKLINASDPCGT